MHHDQLNRIACLLVVSLWSWTVMTVTHELGHVVAGVISGSTLVALELRPWHLPHSHFVGDRFPWITVWAGPVLGSALPLLVASMTNRRSVWFVAWFCLLANGMYLVLGLFIEGTELDARKLIGAGTPPAAIASIAVPACIVGYWKLRRICLEIVQLSLPSALDGISRRSNNWIVAGFVWGVANTILSVVRWPMT